MGTDAHRVRYSMGSTQMAEFQDFQNARSTIDVRTDERVTEFLKRVYGWMFVGLAVTAGVAIFVASQPVLVQMIVDNAILFIAILVAELGLVWWISARVGSLAAPTAAGLFLLYSALNGLTLSFLLLAFTGASIASAFITTAGIFGALALYGSVTRRSLAGIGQFAFMGLVGIIIASIVGLVCKPAHCSLSSQSLASSCSPALRPTTRSASRAWR